MAMQGEPVELARLKGSSAVRSYKPGKYGKGLIQSEAAPQAMIWRVAGGWNGNPHHADVSDALQIKRPNVAFHIAKDRRFYFHSEDPGFVHPKDPAKLAAHVHRQYPKLTWGRVSAEEYEVAHGIREAKARTLAINGRPLRPFEQGAHLHVLDWTHSTVRHRFQTAGAVQVKAAARAIVAGKVSGPPELPALEAAIHAELRNLHAVGHATVSSELDHQRHGRALPIGLSEAPEPPGLRQATTAAERCGTCHMFDNGACWGYGNFGIEPDEVCDSWAAESAKTLGSLPHSSTCRVASHASASHSVDSGWQPDGRRGRAAPGIMTLALADPNAGSLRARARLTVADVSHQIFQAVQRARLHGVSDKRALRQIGRQAGHGALGANASHHAGAAINGGRVAAANANARIVGARYTSVLDKATCGPCAEADTGELIPIGDPRWVPTPNPACLGGGRCRCIHVYQLAAETRPASILPPDDFPAESRQPDRPSGVSAMPVAAVGVGSS